MKHLNWDLHFDENGVHSCSDIGAKFINDLPPKFCVAMQFDLGNIYRIAAQQNIRCSFANAEIRNKILDGEQ